MWSDKTMGKGPEIKGNCSRPACGIFLLSAVIIYALAGCGYTLQTKANLPFEAITIGRIENKTLEPKVQDRLNRALAQAFMEYGFRISPDARYKLEGAVNNFARKALSEKDLTATEYEVAIHAVFRLIDTEKNSATLITLDNPFVTSLSAVGRLETLMSNKELAADRALKDIARELARRIIYAQPGGKPEAETKKQGL